MSIKNLIELRVRAAMSAADMPDDCPANITLSTRPEFGNFQANGAMAAAKRLKSRPRDLAAEIIKHLDLTDIADHVEIAGPGFINIHLSNQFIATQLQKLIGDEKLGVPVPNQQRVVVDYSGPNLAKEMHVGHLRSTIIGDAVVRTLEFVGHDVVRQNHMGDWGTQFGMLIAELEGHLGEGERPELALGDLEVFYQQAKQHFDQDEKFAQKARQYVVKLQSGDHHCRQLWQRFIDISITHSEAVYLNLNVTLKHSDIKAESAYNEDLAGIIESLEQQRLLVEDQGAKVVFLEELADKEGKPSPVIVQKSDGGFLYATTDLAALRHRSMTLQADRVLYFIDARQSLHMKQVFTLAKKAGFVNTEIALEHLPFGTMMGKDGKPFKTRTGGTVKLTELLQEGIERACTLVREKNPELGIDEVAAIGRKVGIGAIKYADLSKTRTNDYIFDWDSMLSFEGNTAPYLQYAYTRIRSIFRRAEINFDCSTGNIILTTQQEKDLALKLLQFGTTLEQLALDGYPHILCNYLYELASSFMTFYEHCPILRQDVVEDTRSSRLAISQLTARVMAKGLNLLGIEVMEQM
ncbi:arginine--tRNA ligase [Porticoccus sp.]|uniref:arginine--tRNA ligase n=1 Tax=Porticoccus sp. TaxID=2024853 RepID=UPI000C68F651|nr:arginine--tRNA ligase [Porticoccus sp.]MAZ71389.1 arginine--tRNA ligase [Porticoccus sp.]|tara:strand:- start:38733 stop:40469 length:1737 start_codon:yes stop_codon:yes gene_type:complete